MNRFISGYRAVARYLFSVFILCLIICFSNTGFSQEIGFMPGFIVTNSNDTIKGFVKNKNLAPYRILQNIKFKKTLEDKTQSYSPQELIGFQAGPNRYVSKDYKEKGLEGIQRSFMEIMVEGDLTYYELRVTGMGVGGEYVYKILQKRNDPFLFSVYGSKWKERLVEYLYDEPAICKKIVDGDFTTDNIKKLTEAYNLLKFKVDDTPYIGELKTVFFYNRFAKNGIKLFLTFNDSSKVEITEGLVTTKKLPVIRNTKVCFGTNDSMTCSLITTFPKSPLTDYYELISSGAKLEIIKRTTKEGQTHIAALRGLNSSN